MDCEDTRARLHTVRCRGEKLEGPGSREVDAMSVNCSTFLRKGAIEKWFARSSTSGAERFNREGTLRRFESGCRIYPGI